ncbi:DUF2764 domain-containing protein [Spirochaetia bacterium 38H-sp]|uniref:DUF2764 domain-containing protein n=1 Tax=Rarispira pelagica TaxID=3141764 RepID=A0ABU9UAK8_9SPIR
MAQYYYFVSSLPLLNFDQSPPMGVSSFLSECSALLQEKDYRILESVLLDRDCEFSSDFARNIREWFRAFNNALVVFRASRLGVGAEKWLRGMPDGYFSEMIKPVFQHDSVVGKQEALYKFVWSFLDECGAGHFFDLEALIVYGLRLSLLEARSVQTLERGASVFDKVFDNLKFSEIQEKLPFGESNDYR